MRPFRFTRKRFLILTTLGILLPIAFLAHQSVRLQREMFGFQNRILHEYARLSVDYAVSEVQDLIRAREREIHMHYRMVALLQDFDAGPELRRIEESYPMIDHAFLMRRDGDVVFAGLEPAEQPESSLVRRAAVPAASPDASLGGLVDLAREHAESILSQVLDAETYEHLLGTGNTHFFRGQDNGAPFHLTAFGLFDAHGEPYGVAGFFLKLPYVREKFLGGVLEEAIEAAEGRFSPNFGGYLTFAVHDHNEELVYVRQRAGQHASPEVSDYLSEAELWDVLPGWTVRLVYSSPTGPKFRRGIWLSNTLLLLLMATMAVVGILLSMRFILRQMELSDLKSHFVSNITHELKTPLAAIRLYTETLQQGRVEGLEQEKKFLGVINKESVRLAHLINNILDFSRIEQGRKRYRFEQGSVGEIVREVVDSYAYQLRDKGFEVRLDVEEGLPSIPVDRDALSQAVLNLIDNAMKYSRDRKEIEVAVGLDPGSVRGVSGRAPGERDNGRQVCIRVRDLGVGIPHAERAKIFEAFYRVEKGLEHAVKGSGLGLAVVKHVAEAHGGTVEVESRRGAGSSFTIRLPVRTGLQQSDEVT